MIKQWTPVRVYWNWPKKLFSVQVKSLNSKGKMTWRVAGHFDYLELQDVTFHVRESGRQKVLRECKKNVHAKIHGRVLSIEKPSLFGKHIFATVTYNPYQNENFISTWNGAVDGCSNLLLSVKDSHSSLEVFHTDYL